MAVAITGIVMVGLIAGLTTVIVSSDAHRHLSDVELVARQYGEALVSQAYHPATATLAADNCTADDPPACSTTLTVSNVQGTFPATPFFVAIDGEVLKVTNKGSGTWSLAQKPVSVHRAGATVFYDAFYDACVYPTHLQPTYTVPSGAKFVAAPTVTGSLEFFASTNAPVADCANSWQNTQPCAGFDSPEHLTNCDPALLRVTIKASTTAASPKQTDTTTRVLVRRGDA